MGEPSSCRLLAAMLLCALPASAAHAATASVATQAIVLKPLSLLKVRDLDFGTIGATPAGGTISLDPDTDVASGTGGAIPSGGSPTAAQFLTYGGPRQNVVVNRGALPVLNRVGGGATMAVTGLSLNGPVNRYLNSAGVLDLRVGATVTVAPNQLPGDYNGTFQIIVTYY